MSETSFVPQKEVEISGKKYIERNVNPPTLETLISEMQETKKNLNEMVEYLAKSLVFEAMEEKNISINEIPRLKKESGAIETDKIKGALQEQNNLTDEFTNLSSEEMTQKVLEYKDLKGIEGQGKKMAILEAAIRNGYIDDVIRAVEKADPSLGELEDNLTGNAKLEKISQTAEAYLGKGEDPKEKTITNLCRLIYEKMGYSIGYSRTIGPFETELFTEEEFEELRQKLEQEIIKQLNEMSKLEGANLAEATQLCVKTRIGYEYELTEDGDLIEEKNEKNQPKIQKKSGELNEDIAKALFKNQENYDNLSNKSAEHILTSKIDKLGYLVGDDIDFERIKKMWHLSKEGAITLWRKIGGGGDLKFRQYKADERGNIQKDLEEKFVFIIDPDESDFKDKEEVIKPGIYKINTDKSLTFVPH